MNSPGQKEYIYRLFGYRLVMPFALPDFDQCVDHNPDQQADVHAFLRGVPVTTPDTSWTQKNIEFAIGDGMFQLRHPALGRVIVKDGSEIFFEPGAEKFNRLVRTFLSNTLMPVIALQRGQIPLHASIVDIGGTLSAFIGISGAGKSTLAAQLHQKGNAILTEDIGVLDFDQQQQVLVRPGIPYFRLWRDSMQHLQIDHSAHPRVWKNRTKHHIPMIQDREDDQEQAILQRVYLLQDADDGQVTISKMTGFEAVQAILMAVPFNILQHSAELYGDFFTKCMTLTRQVDCYRLNRPKDFSLSEVMVETLTQHICGNLAAEEAIN